MYNVQYGSVSVRNYLPYLLTHDSLRGVQSPVGRLVVLFHARKPFARAQDCSFTLRAKVPAYRALPLHF